MSTTTKKPKIRDYPNEEGVESVETERLVVSRYPLPDNGVCDGRDLFVARLKCDRPEVIAHMTYWVGMNYVDWLEVNERERRNGYAIEFRAAIVHMLGEEPNTFGATEAGCRFLQAIGNDADGLFKDHPTEAATP
ncbi:MAG: hypothetical protein AAF658_22000 [Myxococcota bacterium]